MMHTLGRFVDEEIPIDASEVTRLRAFFRDWAEELSRAWREKRADVSERV